jgi:hypothetical protein
MRAFRWTSIVAAVAAICLSSGAASAQIASRSSGFAEVSTGTPAYPAGTLVPSSPTAPAMPAQPAYGGTGGCDVGCGAGCEAGGSYSAFAAGCGSCDPVWHAFGDFLCLRPRNEGVEFAVPASGANATTGVVPLQAGPTFVINPEFSGGFRAGGVRALDCSSEISLSYSYYRDENSVGVEPTAFPLQPMVFNPTANNTFNFTWNDAGAHSIESFQYADIDYRHNLWGCDCTCLNYFVGMRYANLGQEFDATFVDFTNSVVSNMWTHVNFDGIGLRMGLDGERVLRGGFYATAKAAANFLGGEFRADFLQGNSFDAPVEAATTWREARFVTILEAEVAIGWQSPNGRFRTSVGYLLTDWCNAVKPSDFINAVQNNSYHGANQMGNTSLVFDGFTAHAELIW